MSETIDLSRYRKAQDQDYQVALKEIKEGYKDPIGCGMYSHRSLAWVKAEPLFFIPLKIWRKPRPIWQMKVWEAIC